jgi:hypothetical protein
VSGEEPVCRTPRRWPLTATDDQDNHEPDLMEG